MQLSFIASILADKLRSIFIWGDREEGACGIGFVCVSSLFSFGKKNMQKIDSIAFTQR